MPTKPRVTIDERSPGHFLLTPTTAIPGSVKATYEDPELPFEIQVVVRTFSSRRRGKRPLERAARHEIQDLWLFQRSASAPPITTEALRRIPLARITREVVRAATVQAEEVSPGRWQLGDDGGIVSGPRVSTAPPGPGRELDDAFLTEVANVYRSGGARGTKSVCEQWGCPRPTASRWVREARTRGLLEPHTIPTKTVEVIWPASAGPNPSRGGTDGAR